MKKITLQELLATNTPSQANDVIVKNGFKRATSKRELVDSLNRFVRVYKEKALKELSYIHPDKDLILHYANDDVKEKEIKQEKPKYSNFEMEEYLDFVSKKSNEDKKSKNDFLKHVKYTEFISILTVVGLSVMFTLLFKSKPM